MTKILCVGDIHAMDKPPAGATDAYLEDLFSSLAWTAAYAADPKNQIDATVWAGDVFHHKNPSRTSHHTVLRMVGIVEDYQSPLYIVIGNHDISNDMLDSVPEKQPLGVLYKAGAMPLDGWAEGLPLFGVPWQQDWTEEGTPARAFSQWHYKDTRPALAVTHCSIFPPKEAKDVIFEHVPAEVIADAMGNEGQVYYGHIHEYHGIYEVRGVTFANMGALSRGSLHEYNLKRGIHAAVWEDGVFTILDIPHKPATEILRVSEHLQERADKMDLAEFIESVGSSSIDISSTADIIHHIQSMENVEEPIRRRAVELVQSVAG